VALMRLVSLICSRTRFLLFLFSATSSAARFSPWLLCYLYLFTITLSLCKTTIWTTNERVFAPSVSDDVMRSAREGGCLIPGAALEDRVKAAVYSSSAVYFLCRMLPNPEIGRRRLTETAGETVNVRFRFNLRFQSVSHLAPCRPTQFWL
jgi:hypothetical protein